MTIEKVASSTPVDTRMSLYHWLDTLPFHTTLVKRSELWGRAVEQDATICVWGHYEVTPRRPSDEDDGEEFFFY